MAEKVKVVVLNKKTPKGVVNIFSNIQNKVGTYDIDKLEYFKKKLLEKSMKFAEKIIFVFDEIDYAITSASDNFFDRVIGDIENYGMKDFVNDKESSDSVDIANLHSNDEDRPSVIEEIVPIKRINFDDLEPLGSVIDEEEDIVTLQELKMELLSGDYIDKFSKDDIGTRKK